MFWTIMTRLFRFLPCRFASWLALMANAVLLTSCAVLPFGDNALDYETRQARLLFRRVAAKVQSDYLKPDLNGQQWAYWQERYLDKIETRADAYVAIDSMLASLNDPFTRLLRPAAFENQRLSIDSKLYGLGMHIGVRNGHLQVISVLEDTPAAKVNLQVGDWITHVNGESTAGLDIHASAHLIRGSKGTPVELTVRRKGQGKPLHIEAKRDEIQIKTVFTRALKNPNVGYIRLTSFLSERVPEEFGLALKEQSSKPALILDLRGNYGGLLSNALAVADLFLDKKPVVIIEGRQLAEREVLRAKNDALYTGELVVLVDQATASASEIVAGALQDHKRATLVGMPTYGKGLVQKIVHLPQKSGLNLTVSRYLTPKGRDINHKGIVPSKQVELTRQQVLSQDDKQLEAAITLVEERLRVLPSVELAAKTGMATIGTDNVDAPSY